ncbi:MAG: hypothetical protein C3F19_09415 [Rhodocyclales bacterium]|nr:MAG: hypothetical protein C3F19_09415 [Rhodocyclales bacterium]
MLERLKLIFSRDAKEPETLDALLYARRELEQEAEAAHQRLAALQVESNEAMLNAVARDDGKRREAIRKKLDAAEAEVRDLAHAAAGLELRIEAATARAFEEHEHAERAERRALAQQREALAAEMQRHLEAFAGAFRQFQAVGQQIEGKLTRRHIEGRGESDFDLREAINQQLVCRTDKLLGDANTLRLFTVGEFVQRDLLRDLQTHARRQNDRLRLTEAAGEPKAA